MPISSFYTQLPESLSLMNLKHYLLLTHWLLFRPTLLKTYVYQCTPDSQDASLGGWKNLWGSLQLPACRNLFLMIEVIVITCSLLIGFPLTLASNWSQGTPLNGTECLFLVVVGLAFGATFSVVFSLLFSLIGNTTVGITLGGIFGIFVSATLGVALSLAFGTVRSEAFNVAFGSVLGLAFGSAFVGAIALVSGLGTGVIFGLISSLIIGLLLGLISDTWFGITFAVAVSLSALRIHFYPLQFILALLSFFTKCPHPLVWEEMAILPLPGTRRVLDTKLYQGNLINIPLLLIQIRNPFQRWATQVTTREFLHHHPSPLSFIYTLLSSPDFNACVFPSVVKSDWEPPPSLRQALLGELGNRWIDCIPEPLNRFSERLVWWLTQLLRNRRETSLTRFASMLYELLDEKVVTMEDFDLAAYSEIYTNLESYPGGEEIIRSFEALAVLLSYDDFSALPKAREQESIIAYNEDSIRPTVLKAIGRLIYVGAEVAAYRDATSRVNKLAALARATDELDDLYEYTLKEVVVPERYILERIIRQWRRMVSTTSGEIGRAEEEMGPIPNPYVIANPVVGDLFVGREGILRRLEELWSGEGQKPSVVLYGHRRMGKSSILHNLGTRFGPRTVIVDFNMQRVGLVESTSELLYNLALALYDTYQALNTPTSEASSISEWQEPDEENFFAHNPRTAFDRFLKRLDKIRDGCRFIVTVDEFELIEQNINEGQLKPLLLTFWRGLIQTYPWFVMVFAGLHTLQEMTRDYWHPLYGSVIGISVSFLDHEAAWRLITQPTPDFSLDYDRYAVERIISLTHGQPYLVQLIGHGLVTRFNRQTFEQEIKRERHLDLADVEAVINTPEFFHDGNAYFTGVWQQAETTEPPGQTAVLRALAKSEMGLLVDELASRASLAPEEAEEALEMLERHDVVMEQNGHWQFTVELMQRWVAQTEKI